MNVCTSLIFFCKLYKYNCKLLENLYTLILNSKNCNLEVVELRFDKVHIEQFWGSNTVITIC